MIFQENFRTFDGNEKMILEYQNFFYLLLEETNEIALCPFIFIITDNFFRTLWMHYLFRIYLLFSWANKEIQLILFWKMKFDIYFL